MKELPEKIVVMHRIKKRPFVSMARQQGLQECTSRTGGLSARRGASFSSSFSC